MNTQLGTYRRGILLLVLITAMAMPTVSPTGFSLMFGRSPALDAVLSLALSSSGPEPDPRGHAVRPMAGAASHHSPTVIDDLTTAVHAWRPALEPTGRWSPRTVRDGAVATPMPSIGVGLIGLATAAAALSLLACRPLARSLGRMALLRAPPPSR